MRKLDPWICITAIIVNDLASIDTRKNTLLPDSKYSFGFGNSDAYGSKRCLLYETLRERRQATQSL
ncbi:hypothetical protein [uncultured Nostoc sp.]|uniref:hypothetical protein n=1 Tax=uncultured Nostoc sp. TaxID=340711 RepID=UPI0035CBCD2E